MLEWAQTSASNHVLALLNEDAGAGELGDTRLRPEISGEARFEAIYSSRYAELRWRSDVSSGGATQREVYVPKDVARA